MNKYIKEDGERKIINTQLLLEDLKYIFLTPSLVFLLLASFWFFITYAIKALAFSFFAAFVSSLILKSRIFPFKTFIRISAFALTPIFILEFITYSFGVGLFSSPSVVYFVAQLVYIYYAVDSYKAMSFDSIEK